MIFPTKLSWVKVCISEYVRIWWWRLLYRPKLVQGWNLLFYVASFCRCCFCRFCFQTNTSVLCDKTRNVTEILGFKCSLINFGNNDYKFSGKGFLLRFRNIFYMPPVPHFSSVILVIDMSMWSLIFLTIRLKKKILWMLCQRKSVCFRRS